MQVGWTTARNIFEEFISAKTREYTLASDVEIDITAPPRSNPWSRCDDARETSPEGPRDDRAGSDCPVPATGATPVIEELGGSEGRPRRTI